MARVLVSDQLAEAGLQLLRDADGIDVDERSGIDADELRTTLPEYDGLIVRSRTKVTGDVIEAASRLRVIGRAGIGVDNIDLGAATTRGIIVMNAPEGNAITTAEHALGLLFALARRIPQADASMKAGRWEKSRFTGRELCDQVLGVVGLGNVGSVVADRARGLGMRVIAVDPLVSAERAERLGVELVRIDELLGVADAITLHIPLTRDNRHLIGADALARMKDGALLVNAARGGLVDEDALCAALESGKVGGAALDVFESEPPAPDHPLLARDDVIATPHVAGATGEAQVKVAVAIAEQVRDYLATGVVRNAVNLPPVSAAELDELRPYISLGEKLGLFHAQTTSGVSEIEVVCAGEVTDLNVTPVTLAVLKGFLEPWVGARVNFVNAPHIAQQHGIRVIESKEASHPDYRSVLSVRTRGEREQLVEGTIFGRAQPRIVRVDDFMLEAIPEGPALLIRNLDRPGVVGQVGSLLGEARINISRMQLGLALDGGSRALQLLNVDPEPGRDVIDALAAHPAIESVTLLDLGARVT